VGAAPLTGRSEAFGAMCQRLCRARGWELLPAGVRLSVEGGRHQLVEIELFEAEGRELVRLTTTVGSAREVGEARLSRALRWNAELAHGAFAVRDDDLVMTDTLVLEDADLGELEASLAYLAETADRYERLLFADDAF
jgi:hypothetical protein